MEYNPFSLKGKTILVTGASSGLGRAIAVECSRMGAKVVITARNEERLRETLSLMSDGEHEMFCADLTEDLQIESLVSQLPPLDGVVHNAGVGNRVLARAVKRSDIDQVMRPNYDGPVMLQGHLLRRKIIKNEASIVFIASRAPFAPTIGNALYSASKAALIGYSKVLGLELAPKKIRVNCICPAMVWTDLIRKDSEIMGADYTIAQESYPLKRYGTPEDIAHLCIYLLSDASSWMTGSCIDITGGGEHTLI